MPPDEPPTTAIQTEWDLLILGWARAQEKSFSIIDVMKRLFGLHWVPMTMEHFAISTALHRLPRDEFDYSSPILPPNNVCTPTWAPKKQRCEGCQLTRRQVEAAQTCMQYGGHNFYESDEAMKQRLHASIRPSAIDMTHPNYCSTCDGACQGH